jgi:hypothetical protein
MKVSARAGKRFVVPAGALPAPVSDSHMGLYLGLNRHIFFG